MTTTLADRRLVQRGCAVAAARCSLGLGLALLLAALSGCVSQAPVEEGYDFRVQGRLAMRAENEGFSASFRWRQSGDAFDIELWGALGQGRLRLVGDSQGVSVTDSRGETSRGVDPEQLMQQALGWSLPVSVLRHWLLGRPAPGSQTSQAQRDGSGRITGFEQHGWLIELSGFRDSAAGRLPGKIVASRPEGRSRITLLCRNWTFGRHATAFPHDR